MRTVEKKAVSKMVRHNNYAERSFAVVKEFWRMYLTLSLHNLSWLTHSMVNGTHCCADVYGAQTNGTPITTIPAVSPDFQEAQP
jgi:hypothetical protein